MGNSESHCCTERPSKPSVSYENNTDTGSPTDAMGFVDPRSPSIEIERTPIEVLGTRLNNKPLSRVQPICDSQLRQRHCGGNTKGENDQQEPKRYRSSVESDELRSPSLLVDPRSPVQPGARTPIAYKYPSRQSALEQNTFCDLDFNDPRSPSQGIARTPLIFSDEDKSNETEIIGLEELPSDMRTPEETQGNECKFFPSEIIQQTPVKTDSKSSAFIDPRSPSVNVERTPGGVIEKSKGHSETQVVAARNLHDPRSPTTDVSRTPLGVLYGGQRNLRRTVLMTNALLASPLNKNSRQSEYITKEEASSNMETNDEDFNIEGYDDEEAIVPELLLCRGDLLNVSCTSSMVASIGSEVECISLNDSFEDEEAETHSIGRMLETSSSDLEDEEEGALQMLEEAFTRNSMEDMESIKMDSQVVEPRADDQDIGHSSDEKTENFKTDEMDNNLLIQSSNTLTLMEQGNTSEPHIQCDNVSDGIEVELSVNKAVEESSTEIHCENDQVEDDKESVTFVENTEAVKPVCMIEEEINVESSDTVLSEEVVQETDEDAGGIQDNNLFTELDNEVRRGMEEEIVKMDEDETKAISQEESSSLMSSIVTLPSVNDSNRTDNIAEETIRSKADLNGGEEEEKYEQEDVSNDKEENIPEKIPENEASEGISMTNEENLTKEEDDEPQFMIREPQIEPMDNSQILSKPASCEASKGEHQESVKEKDGEQSKDKMCKMENRGLNKPVRTLRAPTVLPNRWKKPEHQEPGRTLKASSGKYASKAKPRNPGSNTHLCTEVSRIPKNQENLCRLPKKLPSLRKSESKLSASSAVRSPLAVLSNENSSPSSMADEKTQFHYSPHRLESKTTKLPRYRGTPPALGNRSLSVSSTGRSTRRSQSMDRSRAVQRSYNSGKEN